MEPTKPAKTAAGKDFGDKIMFDKDLIMLQRKWLQFLAKYQPFTVELSHSQQNRNDGK